MFFDAVKFMPQQWCRLEIASRASHSDVRQIPGKYKVSVLLNHIQNVRQAKLSEKGTVDCQNDIHRVAGVG